jgi:hypothetical protein
MIGIGIERCMIRREGGRRGWIVMYLRRVEEKRGKDGGWGMGVRGLIWEVQG